nr:DUF2946 domain-containing protein [Pseudomonas sp. BSw22131]
MLMIFIGPLISQAMPIEHHAGMSASVPATMDMTSDMEMSGGHAGMQHAPDADNASVDHVMWAKCGYCTLLFSCPALPQALAIIAPTLPKPNGLFNPAPHHGHAYRSVFPNARSRAPPLSSLA